MSNQTKYYGISLEFKNELILSDVLNWNGYDFMEARSQTCSAFLNYAFSIFSEFQKVNFSYFEPQDLHWKPSKFL